MLATAQGLFSDEYYIMNTFVNVSRHIAMEQCSMLSPHCS